MFFEKVLRRISSEGVTSMGRFGWLEVDRDLKLTVRGGAGEKLRII